MAYTPHNERIEPRDILLIVVNYNQRSEIENFLNELQSFWPQERITVVDDGSTDGSDTIPALKKLRTLKHESNKGIGAAIRTGIMDAKSRGYKAVLIMSSNGKMKASEIDKIIHPVINGDADYTTGSRYLPGGSSPHLPLFRKIVIPAFSLLASVLLRRRTTDITCGFRCYKINFLFNSTRVDISQKWLNRYQLEYYIHFYACKNKLRIKEIPVQINYRHLEKNRISKIKIWDYGSIILPLVLLRIGIRK